MPDVSVTGGFMMFSARAAFEDGLSHIEEQIKALERAVIENPGLAFDLAKTVVESTCKTILSERKISFEPDDDLPRLFRAVTARVPLLPTAASSEVDARKSLLQTLNGLHTALQGICELRNAYGFASHGVQGPRPSMESAQALLVAQAADAIVGFAYKMHRGGRPSPQTQRSRQSKTVDKVIDVNYEPVLIAGQPYTVSEALHAIDAEAYFALAAAVKESRNVHTDLSTKYPNSLNPDIEEVSFVHFEDSVYLKVAMHGAEIVLTDTEFISSGENRQYFSPLRSPDENADRLLTEFDPYSIINCFDLFTAEAAARVAEAYEGGKLGLLPPPVDASGEAKT